MHSIEIGDAPAMEAFGARLANQRCSASKFFLQGMLGAGKTTLVRGFLRALGYEGIVKSPSYTLVESYQLGALEIFHFDLYRINAPEELASVGLRDYFAETAICFVEWPEKGAAVLGQADIHINIEYQETRRRVSLNAATEVGKRVITTL